MAVNHWVRGSNPRGGVVGYIMARVCDICGKGNLTGNKVSKSKHHTKRVWKPNLLKMKTELGGNVMTVRICARCLKSGYLTKKV